MENKDPNFSFLCATLCSFFFVRFVQLSTHVSPSIPSLGEFDSKLESYLLRRIICLIAITNRYIVLASLPLGSMLIFNSKGSWPRCLSCNRIKRKADCNRASGCTFIIRFLSRYRERKTETLRRKREEKRSINFLLFFSFIP